MRRMRRLMEQHAGCAEALIVPAMGLHAAQALAKGGEAGDDAVMVTCRAET